jgi:AcrR family transcriptional regulator
MPETKKERTRREIIQAAENIVLDKGHEAVTVRYLAETTGYSYTNLYYYFKDLNALLWDLRLYMIDNMIAVLTSVAYQKEDPVDEITAVFGSYADYYFEKPNIFRFFYFYNFVRPEGDVKYEELEKRMSGMWQSTFSRLVQEGLIRAGDIDLLAKAVIFAVQGMIMLTLSSNGAGMNRESVQAEIKKLINYLLIKKL